MTRDHDGPVLDGVHNIAPITQWSVITVTHNSADALSQYWTKPIPPNVEWIVVDNKSTDESVGVAQDAGAKVISLDANLGFSHANNIGFEASSGSQVAFVNPDVSVGWESLPQLAERVSGRSMLVGPQLVYPDGSLQPNGRGTPSLPNKIRNRLRPRARDAEYRLYAYAGEDRIVSWLTGAAIVGSRTTFLRLGKPWDDSYFLYYEDTDLCLRAWEQGIEVMVTGDVQWVHAWARETATFRLGPWKREVASLIRFYARRPALLVSDRVGRKLEHAQLRWGELARSDDAEIDGRD